MKPQIIAIAIAASVLSVNSGSAIGQVPPEFTTSQEQAKNCEPGNPNRREDCPRNKEDKTTQPRKNPSIGNGSGKLGKTEPSARNGSGTRFSEQSSLPWCKQNEEPGNPAKCRKIIVLPEIKNCKSEGKGCVKVVVLEGQTLEQVCESAGLKPKENTTDMCCER